jgi:hypothetical protein
MTPVSRRAVLMAISLTLFGWLSEGHEWRCSWPMAVASGGFGGRDARDGGRDRA